MKIEVCSFPAGGEYIVCVDGVGWCYTKSLRVARRIGRSLARVAHDSSEDYSFDEYDVRHVDQALHYEEDDVPQWPRVKVERLPNPPWEKPNSVHEVYRTRVVDELLRYSIDGFKGDEYLPRMREAAVSALDKAARPLWDKINKGTP